ncbi:MAG: hypothetical protein IAG13_29765 [Deltaproteobacteria bacterium]|nr:hypothetical protein [Nannocystaceae bacterium]
MSVPGKRVDLDRLFDFDLFDDDRQVVGEMIAVPALPPKPVEPPKPIEVEPLPPDVTHVRMGMISAVHEPCDPPKLEVEPSAELPRWDESMR